MLNRCRKVISNQFFLTFLILILSSLSSPIVNYRATKVLAKDGYYRFYNWFDPTAWYPLGRAAGGTLYPGLMVTSGAIYNALHAINLPVDIRNVCVLLAPAFSGLTAWATYKFTATMKDDAAGLLAAAFIGIAPGEYAGEPK